jgi:uncharacterized protein (TIGR00369 family)
MQIEGCKTMKQEINRVRSSYLPTYDGCYVCGQSHPHGLRLRFFTGDFGQVCTHFTPDHNLTGYNNIVHGGVISALLDELMGWPIALQTGRMFVTGELSVRYLKPVTVGSTYLAVALPGIDCGKYWQGSGEIRDDQGLIYAKAKGKYFILSEHETAQIAHELRYQPGDPPVFHYRVEEKPRSNQTNNPVEIPVLLNANNGRTP